MSVQIVVGLNILPQLAASLGDTLENALDKGVQVTYATSFQLARVDTGVMRADVTTERSAGTRVMTWNREHAIYNEFGTYKMSAQPFVRPGADAGLQAIEAELATWPGR